MKLNKKIAALFSALTLCASAQAFAAAEVETRIYNNDEDIQYPYVILEDAALAKEINLRTEGLAHDFVRKVIRTKENSVGPVTASLSYEVTYNDDSYFSVVYTEYRYVAPAAHPMVEKTPQTFDLVNGRRMTATDLGAYTPEALGDYWAGPNHTLPTMGTARFSSPLSVDEFIKRSSYICYTEDALRAASAGIATLARSEGLEAHARSVEIRFEGVK